MFLPGQMGHCDHRHNAGKEQPVPLSEGCCAANSPAQLAWPVLRAKGRAALTSVPVDEDARALQEIGTKLRIARNETIFSQGEAVTYAYKVVSGVVRLCKHMSDGRRHIAQFAFPGDFFSMTESERHNFTAEAVTGVVLMCYAQGRLAALRDARPTICQRLVGCCPGISADWKITLPFSGAKTPRSALLPSCFTWLSMSAANKTMS